MIDELQRLKDEVLALKTENKTLTNLNECLMTTAEKIAANIIRVYSQLESKSPMRAKAFRALMKWEQLRRLTLTSELRQELDALNFSFTHPLEKESSKLCPNCHIEHKAGDFMKNGCVIPMSNLPSFVEESK